MMSIVKQQPSIRVKGTDGAGRMRRRSSGPGILFLLPSILGVMTFVLAPFIDVIRRSFVTAMGSRWVGTQNYATVFANQAFQLAAWNTVRFLVVCIPILLLFSLLLALILYAVIDRAGLLKTAFLIPMAIPVASVVMLWQSLFHTHGLVNAALMRLGGEPIGWMDSDAAFWVLIGTFVWKNVGYNMVLWIAALAAIPSSLFEAARVDGAGSIRIFWSITLPNLLPALYTILVLSLLNAFKVFREAYLVAGDYPHRSIYLLQHLFGNWFRELSMEKLAAAAVVVALTILAVLLIFQRLWERRESA